jgi:hypothetical protein
MSDNIINDRFSNQFQKVKETSGKRAAKIRETMQPALSETLTEVKAGSTEVWAIAKDFSADLWAELITDFKAKASNAVNTSATEQNKTLLRQFKAFAQKIAALLKNPPSQDQVKQTVTTQVTTQMNVVDQQLAEKYGDRYEALKQKVTEFKAQYAEKQQEAITIDATVVEVEQGKWEEKAANVGVAIADKEAELKDNLKQTVQSFFAKP